MTESPVQKHETTKLHSLHYMKFLVACHWPLILTPTNAQIELMNVISKRTKNYGPPNTFITQLIPGDIFNAAATSKRLEGTLINNSAFNF